MTQLRLGTRASQLALAQAETIARLLRANGHEVEIVKITTTGDRVEGPVAEYGGKGIAANSPNRVG